MFERLKSIGSGWGCWLRGESRCREAVSSSGTEEPPAGDRVARTEVLAEEEPGAWKEKALADFSAWLKDLPDSPGAPEAATPDGCDLYTLLSEFSALRQEIRMQNRQQHKSLRAVKEFSQEADKNAELLRSLAREYGCFADRMSGAVEVLEGVPARILGGLDALHRREIENRTVMPFLDLRGALIRGRDAAQAARPRRGRLAWFWRRSRFHAACSEMDGVVEGYEMALRRFDRALHAVGIEPVDTVGKPFDPKTMRAVGTSRTPGIAPGVVVREQFCGFVRGDEIIRTAEVVVNE